ncbi:MAG: oligosaccharide flippase family protein [Anaerolineae bacterium]|nr:oligosaccharide flippase family protein [Anaerolineae bacterium]
MRRRAPDLLIILLLLLLPLIYYAPVTLGDRTLLPADNLYQWQPFRAYREVVRAPEVTHNALLSDLILENYVWKQFIRESIANRELPLWNPHLFAGVPFLAAGQHSALYPLSLLHYILPLESSYGWYAVIQLWIAGLTMLALARGLGQGRIGATVAAVSWQLSGFFLVSTVFPMIQSAAAWLPLLILMIEYVVRSQPLFNRPATLPWAAAGAVTLALVIYAGHVEITYYTLLVMAFYAAWRLLAGWWATRREGGATGWLLRRGTWLVAMVGAGLLLGAAQIVPLIELVSRNFREGSATLEQILGWAYPKRQLLAFLMPNFFGNPAHHAYFDVFSRQMVPVSVNALGQPITVIDWGIKNYVEGGAYLGILPLALAAYALASAWRRGADRDLPAGRPYRAIFAALGAIALTFVFGLPTYAVLYYLLPGINQLHSPFRWVFPLTLAVAVLAGFGADALARRVDSRLTRWFGWGLTGAGGLTLLGLAGSYGFYPQLEPLIDRALRSLALAENAFADARMFYSYQFTNVLLLGVFLLLAGGMFLLNQRAWALPPRRGWLPLWAVLAVIVVALDLLIASAGFNPAADPALLDFTPPAFQWLRGKYAEEGSFRITTLDAPGANTANANIPWMFGLEDVRGYDSIIPRQYTDYMRLISPQFQLEYNRVAPLTTDYLPALDSPLLDMLNVRYIMTESTIENPIYRLVYEDEAVRIYENTHVMPRAYTLPVRATLTYDSLAGFQELLNTPGIDLHRAVLRYDPAQPTSAAGALLDADPVPQVITTYRGLTVLIDATISEPSWLVLADSYFEGWRAFIRPAGADDDYEQELPVMLVNGNFRAVQIDPAALAEHYAEAATSGTVTLSNTWTVRFRYSPASFQIGAFLSFITGAAIAFAAGVWLWRTFYRSSDEEAGTVQRLAKNSAVPILMNLFNKGIDFAFAFIMLRVLGPENAGIYYYAVVVFGWFDILTNFGLNTYLTREVARRHEQAGRYLLNTSLLRIGLAALGVPLLIGFLATRQATVTPPLTPVAIGAIVLLYIGLLPNSLSTGLSALFYAFEKAEYPAAIATVSTFSKAVLGLLALVAGWGVVGLAGVSIITNLITLGLMLWLARPLLGPRREMAGLQVERSLIRHMLGESWPLMINHLLATIFYKIDVILMEAINGATVVGWYSTAYKWLDALQVIPAFLSAALLPVMSRQAQEDPPALVRSYRLAVKLLVLVALPVAVATTFVAGALVLFLGGEEYLPDGAVALQIMVWSIPLGWINSVTQYVLIALDRQRLLTRAFIMAVAVNITANLILLPLYSYRAAAVIHIISEGLLLALFLGMLRPALREHIPADATARTVALPRLLGRPALAAALMFSVMAVLWGVNGPLALAAGVGVYAGTLIALPPFDAGERAQLRPLLPGQRQQARPTAAESIPGE